MASAPLNCCTLIYLVPPRPRSVCCRHCWLKACTTSNAWEYNKCTPCIAPRLRNIYVAMAKDCVSCMQAGVLVVLRAAGPERGHGRVYRKAQAGVSGQVRYWRQPGRPLHLMRAFAPLRAPPCTHAQLYIHDHAVEQGWGCVWWV